jgi:hypothetical protein
MKQVETQMQPKRRKLTTHSVDEGKGKSIGIRLTGRNNWPLEMQMLADCRGLIGLRVCDSQPDVCFAEILHEHGLNPRDNCLRIQQC